MTDPRTPAPVGHLSDTFDAGLHLLDHQVRTQDGDLICKVDDLELSESESGDLSVTAILVGPGALGDRTKGRLGNWTVAIWRRLRPDAEPQPGRIDWAAVTEIESAIVITHLPDDRGIDGFGTWLDRHVIRRIPGSGHAPE